MRYLKKARSFLRNLFFQKTVNDDLDQEVRSHLDLLTDENVRAGMPWREARRRARLELGGVDQVKEQVHDARTGAFLDSLFQDVRFAFRTLAKNPGFTLSAVLILTLGISANIIVFGVLQALVLRPLDVPHADRVKTLARNNQTYPIFTYPEIRDVRDNNSVFTAVGAFAVTQFGLEANNFTRAAWGMEVDGQYFEVVGIKPFLGRLLNRADSDHPGASDAAMISWAIWSSDFGSDPNIIGKNIRLNKHSYTIVGVTPPGFNGTEKILQPDIYIPMSNEASIDGVDWLDSRTRQQPYGVVLVKEGVTPRQVQDDLDAIAARAKKQYPKEEDDLGYHLTRPGLVGDFIGKPVSGFLVGIMVLAGIVLLAACANLGSLFAARTADRAKEIAIRMAIGSSRWRILRQILVEAFVVAIAGGACACFLAWIALTNLSNWHPPTEFPMRFFVMPRPSLVVAALVISVLAGILFGLMPLRQIFKADPNDAIKGGGSQAGTQRRWALRDVLLAAQIALCCVTVTAAFVSLRGLHKSLTMDLGFNTKNVIRTTLDLGQSGYSDDDSGRFQRRLLESVSHLPGVDSAGYANITQLSLYQTTLPVYPQTTSDFRPSNSAFEAFIYDVSPGLIATTQTPLLAGRDVSFEDTSTTPPVAVVNQEFARRLFQSEDVVGRYFKTQGGKSVRIIGLMGDGKQFTLAEDPEAAMYFPTTQASDRRTTLMVRTRRDTGDMVATIREIVRNQDRSVPVLESGTWDDALALAMFPSRLATIALGIFGAFGLLLSIAGTFGLASYSVSKRMRELSIRVALGAQAKQILATALGRMLTLLAVGSVIGVVLGVAASRVLSAVVYQATAKDPFVLAGVVFTMLATGLLSVAGPVRRALHVDPAKLLREQ